MKLLHVLPPVVALVAGGFWTGYQRQRLGSLERESDLLRGSIDSARHTDAGAAYSSSLENSKGVHDPKAAVAGKKIDWKKVLEMQKNRTGDVADMRLMIEMQKKLTSLTAGELLAQLDEIAAMDATEADKAQLESMLIGVLAQKDPEKVMERFASWIASDRMTWQLNDAFQKWAAKDLTAATAWMERQIEAGTFDSKSLDGRSSTRAQFEGSLMTSLLQSDPKGAEERIKALPDDQRSNVFNNLFYRLKPGTEKAAVDAMRATLPADQY
ncbi:MAG: hypothetical protein JWO82_3750, partial [Akkermansiaceae bacterium]|nr:hypothetical protein [Akkermansiaceae bacterium]